MFENYISVANKWLTKYVDEHKGETILTDYDEDLNYFNAIFPLNDVTTGAIVDKKLMAYLQQINKAFKRS